MFDWLLSMLCEEIVRMSCHTLCRDFRVAGVAGAVCARDGDKIDVLIGVTKVVMDSLQGD